MWLRHLRLQKRGRTLQRCGVDPIIGRISCAEIGEVDLLDMVCVHPVFQRLEILAPIEVRIEENQMAVSWPADELIEEREAMGVDQAKFNSREHDRRYEEKGPPPHAHFLQGDSADQQDQGINRQD